MFNESRGFVSEAGRDLTPATWTLPDGERVLVCRAEGGFTLFTLAEWNNATVPDYGADAEGRVRLHGRYVDPENPAWVVPAAVRDQAVPAPGVPAAPGGTD